MVEESEIEEWLDQMKQMIRNDRFKIEMNQNRVGNIKLFQEYLINEENVKSILLNLTVNDFCEKVQNEHVGFRHEWLYIFGKEISLLKRYEDEDTIVPLYIKLNMLENKFLIISILLKSNDNFLEDVIKPICIGDFTLIRYKSLF